MKYLIPAGAGRLDTGLYSFGFTVIFRRALPFVYGLKNFVQKPERQQYTDTD
ncbi:hypothetical protein [Marinobacter litoralis]|uniref:hypothetical protein n=1 Tax=Marinobacter litoralis TaxID=187981 RepID=UPI0018EAD237|nr:hypothetical protein [Marinobacter litoralis]MBJ6137514.1 hypothetical protein [Marinobacter litoralis]